MQDKLEVKSNQIETQLEVKDENSQLIPFVMQKIRNILTLIRFFRFHRPYIRHRLNYNKNMVTKLPLYAWVPTVSFSPLTDSFKYVCL